MLILAKAPVAKDNRTIKLYYGTKFMFVDHIYCHTISAIRNKTDESHFDIPTKTDKFRFPRLSRECDYLIAEV